MMNTLKLFNDEKLREVIGGKHDRLKIKGNCEVTYEEAKAHMGTYMNKYETESHIGYKVVAKLSNWFGTWYYIGVIADSYEDGPSWWSQRVVEIRSFDGGGSDVLYDPECFWSYIG